MSRTLLVGLGVTLGLLLVAPAQADVIEGPEDDDGPRCPPSRCPPGSTPYAGGHGSCSPGCSPGQPCETAADCPDPERYECLPTAWCIAQRGIGRGVLDVVAGDCGPEAECEEGTCERLSRCVYVAPASAAAPPGQASGSGCSGCAVGEPASSPSAWWAIVLAAGLALSRRARERLPLA